MEENMKKMEEEIKALKKQYSKMNSEVMVVYMELLMKVTGLGRLGSVGGSTNSLAKEYYPPLPKPRERGKRLSGEELLAEDRMSVEEQPVGKEEEEEGNESVNEWSKIG